MAISEDHELDKNHRTATASHLPEPQNHEQWVLYQCTTAQNKPKGLASRPFPHTGRMALDRKESSW